MEIMMCGKCLKPTPDSFHNFVEICDCLTKQEWIDKYRRNKWMLRIDGELYNFVEDEEE